MRKYRLFFKHDIVVLAPGINEKASGADKPCDKEGRLRLLDTNEPIFRDVVPKVIAAAPDAILLVATNPLDPMVELTRRLASGKVIKGKGASEFGIGTVVARVVEMILRDECMVVPVSAYSEKYGVTLSLPRRVGRSGVLNEFEIEANKEEQEGISNSVEALKAAMKRLDRSKQAQHVAR
jgi:malate/lactate dehydrogenase